MSTQNIGHAAHRAVTFLEELHRDVHAVVSALDGMMYNHGWGVPQDMGTSISNGLGNGFGSKSWVLKTLTRIYVPQGEAGPSRAITFSIDFAPAAFDESMCLIVVAEFAPSISSIKTQLWARWNAREHVMERLANSARPVELTRAELNADFMPTASRAQAFLVPLARLDEAQRLESEVVRVALELART